MNILAIVQSASLFLDLERPQVVFSSTDRVWQEMASTINMAAQQILDDYDWSDLIRTATITGDGVQSAFPLPTDYSRMVKDASLIGQQVRFHPSQQVQNFNHWLELEAYPIPQWQQRWMIFGGNVNVFPAVSNTNTLRYGYITTQIVNGSDPTTFTADTDTFVLDDEMLRLGIIWNWKQAKGFDFAADLAKYEERKESVRFSDPSPQNIVIGGSRRGGYGLFGGFR